MPCASARRCGSWRNRPRTRSKAAQHSERAASLGGRAAEGHEGRQRSAPGEVRLLEMVDPLANTLERHAAELVDDRAGGRVDEIFTDRKLHHRAVALGDGDEAG